MRENKREGNAVAALLSRTGYVAAKILAPLFFLVATGGVGAGAAPEKIFDLAIARGALAAEQLVLRVHKGDTVRLRLTSDTPGDFHLHGYRLGTSLTPGTAADLSFKAHATGRYRLEWHPAGELKSGRHHGAPLATLEVRPQ